MGLKSQFCNSESNILSASRSRSCDKKREVKFEDEVYGKYADKRHRTLSQSAVCGDKSWISYADVVTGYGVPPGFDVEQYSDYLSDGVQVLNGHSRNQATMHMKQAALREASRKHSNKLPSSNLHDDHPDSNLHKMSSSSLAPPPRTKHKQQRMKQNIKNGLHQRQHSTSQSNLQSVPSISELELNSELASYNTSLDDLDFDDVGQSKKKSKLLWKKNKGRFTPTKEVEKIQNRIGGLSRSSSKTSVASSLVGDADSVSRPVLTSGDHTAHQRSAPNMVEQVSGFGRPMEKPPPVPKPKHLSKQHNTSTLPESNFTVRDPEQKPSLAPKPQVGHANPSTGSEKKRVNETDNRCQNNNRTTSVPDNKKFSQKSRSRSSGYEDVDVDLLDEKFMSSENVYESVGIVQNIPTVTPAEPDISGFEEDVEEYNEAAIDVPPGE